MTLRVLYFGIVRERLSRRAEDVDCSDDTSVGQLLALLAERHSLFGVGAGSLRVAVNREYVGNDHRLKAGDEVAIIPPVAGGAGESNVSYR